MRTGVSCDVIRGGHQGNNKNNEMRKWQASFSRVIETLNYFGIEHSEKMTYTQKKDIELSKCCILNIRDEKSLKGSHMAVYFDKKFYDPVYGISEKYNRAKIISFLEIKV